LNLSLKLVLVFWIAFSLAAINGPISSSFHLPRVAIGHANLEFGGLPPCPTHGSSGACSNFWYPAGPAMNTLQIPIFTDASAEYLNLQSSTPAIDFTDSPCPGTETTGVCGALINSPNFLVTNPIGQVGYYELQFMMANTFWNCNFNYGNNVTGSFPDCGRQIRQGIAHLIDMVSFAANQPTIAGTASPLDNPVPATSAGGLPTPNPCADDLQFPESGTNCVVGSPGGTAYHLGSSGNGANGIKWLYPPGSPDLNAAAQHFVNAGVASGFNRTSSRLINPVVGTTPSIFIRGEDAPRKDLGESLESQICYLFTGSYSIPCSPYIEEAPIPPQTIFPGFTTSTTSVNLSWWMYTASYIGPTFFDGSLFSTFNSRLVSGVSSNQPPTGPCSPRAVPTASAPDYMYLCNPSYDSLSSQMETAPCLTAPGDPAVGSASNFPTSPGNGLCPGTSLLSAVSAGIQAEAYFGANVFTLPIFERTVQFGFLNNGWIVDINGEVNGLPNHFTWLNAWNPSPPTPRTIRQGFSDTTRSVNPYIASTPKDSYIINDVYDSLYVANPLSPSQFINWMTATTSQQTNSSLTYVAPSHTLTTYRFTLRPDVFFQDGRAVSAYDVAFSYLSMVASGAYLSSGATSMTGVTVLNPRQLDIGVNSLGPFTLPNLARLPIVPGRYWTTAGSSAWDSAVNTCTTGASCAISQYTLSGSTVNCSLNCSTFSANLMTVNPNDITLSLTAIFDPIASHIFIGSGPWQCGTVTSSGSGNCSSSGGQNPSVGGSYTLTRFGNGLAPASSTRGIYFRSSGDLALWIWSQENDVNPITALSAISLCYGQPVSTTGPCAHWQHGIGASSNGIVGINQVAIVALRFNLNWVSPFEWGANVPLGIGALPPVLREGSVTLNPCSVDSINGYDC
jgi:Bacterial extracellular solute-binding proteins, family 5 Middle